MRNVSDKKMWRKLQLIFYISNFFFSFENLAVYEKMWRKISRAGQATDDCLAHALCMLDTYGYKLTISEYVIRIGFPLQQWLH